MPQGVVMAALQIRRDDTPSDLRQRAARERDRRAALRLLALANALEGMTRAEAARLAGMERQALHDAVLRFNAEGPEGLHDRPRPGRPERLNEGQQAALKAHILRRSYGALIHRLGGSGACTQRPLRRNRPKGASECQIPKQTTQ